MIRHKGLVAIVAALVIGAACSGGTEEAGPSDGQADGAALPFDEQVLTVATPGDVYVTRDRVMLGIWPDNPNVCETLVRMDHDFQTEPGLATGWEYRGDNTFRFSLREGVVFHNGAPLDAEAVRYSMNRVVEEDLALTTFIGPDSTQVVDELTVDITTTQPNLRLPSQLVHNFFSIVAPGTDPVEAPVCTGPFRFVEYEPNQQLVVERNDDYWGEEAKLKQMTFRFIPDANTRRLALEAGDVDVIYDLPPQQVEEAGNRPGLKVAEPPPGAIYVASLNLNGQEPHVVLQDPEVRKALALSIDSNAVVEQLYDGNAESVDTVAPPSILGDSVSLVEGYDHDLDEAIGVLEAAGWQEGTDGIRERDGRRLSLLMLAQFDVNPELLPFIQAQAREAGIDLQLDQAPDAGIYADKVAAGAFDIDLNYFNQNDANPARIVTAFWYGGQDSKRVTYTNPGEAFDRLIEESLNATDPEASTEAAAEAMSVLVDDEVAAIPISSFPFFYGLAANVEGFDPHPSVNDLEWTDVQLVQE
jgi:peptide/nickel transport system substrate-binding protein